jgi:hypothetical protein
VSVPIGSATRSEGAFAEPVRVGRHATSFEEPDIIYMRLAGNVTDEEVAVVNAHHLEYSRGRSRVFFLIDLEELEGLPNSVRKAVLETLNQIPIGGFSVYKAPLTARVLAKLIVIGMRLFGKHIPLQFWDTEAEARAWIEQRRTMAA